MGFVDIKNNTNTTKALFFKYLCTGVYVEHK